MTRYGDARIMVDRYDGQTSVAANFSGSVFLDHRGVASGDPPTPALRSWTCLARRTCRFGSTERRSAGPTSKAASW